MAAIKSLVSAPSFQAALLVLLVTAMVQTQTGSAQSCPAQLNNLNRCAPFAVPGAENSIPSSECCAALGAVTQDCFCNTFRISSTLPSKCNLPLLSCGAH